MEPLGGPWDTPPEHVNEKSVKFWLDADLTRYAARKSLTSVRVYFAEEPDGQRIRLIVDSGDLVYASQNLEAVACRLDVMSFLIAGGNGEGI